MKPIDRFMSKTISTSNGCIEYQGYTSKRNKYPLFWVAGKPTTVHKWIYEYHNGPMKLHILHTCDNTKCVNIKHLWTGTHKQNMEDMTNKERAATLVLSGDNNGMAKLTKEQVLEIVDKCKTRTRKSVAADYDVTPTCIERIMNGKRWSHFTTII
jgi:hypothetical protein